MLLEWKLRDIEAKADDAIRKSNEIYSLRSDVDRLERSNRELSSQIDGLRYELQTLQDQVRNYMNAT